VFQAGIPDESIHPDGESNPGEQVVLPSKGDHQGQSLHLLKEADHVRYGNLHEVSRMAKDLDRMAVALAWLHDYPEGSGQASPFAVAQSRNFHTPEKYEDLMGQLRHAEFRLKFNPADTLVCLSVYVTRML
jgi:hypothetical protein